MSGQPKPHRKKTLPVPGDVFIGSDDLMRIILPTGYDVEQFFNYGIESEVDTIHHGVRFHKAKWEDIELRDVTPESFLHNWDKYGFYYLGNALTDEWENG